MSLINQDEIILFLSKCKSISKEKTQVYGLLSQSRNWLFRKYKLVTCDGFLRFLFILLLNLDKS